MSNQSNIYKLFQQLKTSVLNSEEWSAMTAESKIDLTVRYLRCTVDESWIAAIEQGMVFVGKAIDEERRFIRSNGEVQPIEKVKRISKESVQHLARHSELITREQPVDSVFPDKLFTVERLNDYATYENRFLYNLLVTVKRFLNERYAAIARAMGEYGGTLTAEQKFTSSKRSFAVTVTMNDERHGDDYLTQSAVLTRLDKLNRTVEFYLRTPLMTELSKEDTVRFVTKNNVLAMDKNFSETVKLYDRLLSYEGTGFTVTEEEKTLDSLPDLDAVSALVGFVSYINGIDLSEHLQNELDASESECLSLLKQRGEKGLSDYVTELEKRSERLNEAEARLEQLGSQLQLSMDLADLAQERNEELTEELEQSKLKTEQIVASYSEKLSQTEQQAQDERCSFEERMSALTEQNLILKAQIAALREQLGQSGDGCQTEADFDELERMYEALGRLVSREWQGTKAMLRKQKNAELKQRLFGKNNKGNGDGSEKA